MKEIFIWVIISSLLFIGFLAAVVFAFIRRKKINIVIVFISLLFLSSSALWTVYLAVSKSYNRVVAILAPRTGHEIYVALFGETKYSCLNVLNHQDQFIPKIDYAIWLYFETCPEEMKRILSRQKYEAETYSTKGWNGKGPNWFKPETLGDSIRVFTYRKDDFGNIQELYSSLDSTKAFCIDILD